MKKLPQYFLLILGWISGTILTIWLFRQIHLVLDELQTKVMRVRSRSGPLPGEGTTDAPPPSNPPTEETEKVTSSISDRKD
jgi:hypothetical protein